MKLKNNNETPHNKDSVGKVTGFFLFRNLINNYNHDKTDDANRPNIKRYGVRSIILTTISILLVLSCLLSRLTNFAFFGFSFVLITIIYVVGGVLISSILSIYACVFAIMQVRLNRKAVGILGLILSVVSMGLSVVLLVFIFL